MTNLEINQFYERREDMSPEGRLRLLIQEDGDIIVQICGVDPYGEPQYAKVEFCAPGSGGGRSPATMNALRALILAMENDNKDRPFPTDV